MTYANTAICFAAALSVAPLAAQSATAEQGCCRAPAGTVVVVELATAVSTKTQKSGDRFALRLAAPLIVDGRVVLRAGAPGVGEVVDSAKPGLGGKPAKLVLAARFLTRRHLRVPLQGLQLSGVGNDNSTAAQAVGLTGIVFAPLGFVGLAIHGGDVAFPAGTRATAEVASEVRLPSLGRASRRELAAAEVSEPAVGGTIEIPPPSPGMGEVIFFRDKTVLGSGQWFNVREGGKALGKLTNGAYFIQMAEPGVHKYTAATEPELKDHLKLEIAAGRSYYVEGTLTKGVVIGTADLSPSDRAVFDRASKDLKLAPPPTTTTADAASSAQPPAAAPPVAASTAPPAPATTTP